MGIPEPASPKGFADAAGHVTDVKRIWYRTTGFQIAVVSACAFCAPGIWSAMNGLGVGGSASPDLINAANAILYGFMTVTCFLGPFFTNITGFKIALAWGAAGYPLYAAALYVNNRYGTVWFVYLGAVACGVTAGTFWSVEGAIATGYPEAHKRGRYIATWFTARNFGNIIGGSISLGLNHKVNHKGKVGYAVYQVFIAIQCLGAPLGLFLSNPEKVQRSDGTKIEAPRGIKLKTEALATWKLFLSKPILLLTPLFWYFGWMQAYPGTYFATYFTVRSRALGSFLSAVVGSLATWVTGLALDLNWASKRTRAIWVFYVLAAANTGIWIWAIYIQNEYRKTKPSLDWSDQSTFGRGFGLYMMERVALGGVENFIYWAIGNLADSPAQQIRYSSLLRGIETAAVALGFGVQAVPTELIITAGLNFGFWMVALPFGFYATRQVVKVFDEQEAQRRALQGESSQESIDEKVA